MRSAAIPLVMMVTFSLVLGFHLREHRNPERPAIVDPSNLGALTRGQANAPLQLTQTGPSENQGPSRDRTVGVAPTADYAAAGSTPEEGTTNAALTEEVPVRFKIRPDPARAQITAILKNMSIRPITVTVSAENLAAGTFSAVTVTIEASANTSLTDAGLIVSEGDRITIRSPPYQDQVFVSG